MKNVISNYLLVNKIDEMKNAISWFEIPATDLNRATNFYEMIFNVTLNPLDLPNIKMRMFPLEDMMGVGGAVVDSGGFHKPSTTDGPLIYLNGNPDLQKYWIKWRLLVERSWFRKQKYLLNMDIWR